MENQWSHGQEGEVNTEGRPVFSFECGRDGVMVK